MLTTITETQHFDKQRVAFHASHYFLIIFRCRLFSLVFTEYRKYDDTIQNHSQTKTSKTFSLSLNNIPEKHMVKGSFHSFVYSKQKNKLKTILIYFILLHLHLQVDS